MYPGQNMVRAHPPAFNEVPAEFLTKESIQERLGFITAIAKKHNIAAHTIVLALPPVHLSSEALKSYHDTYASYGYHFVL